MTFESRRDEEGGAKASIRIRSSDGSEEQLTWKVSNEMPVFTSLRLFFAFLRAQAPQGPAWSTSGFFASVAVPPT